MLKHPAAAEGRHTYGLIYAAGDAPVGLAARLRKRGGRLLRSDDPRVQQIGIFLHGLAEADETRASKEGR
jgi:hypothetical protein